MSSTVRIRGFHVRVRFVRLDHWTPVRANGRWPRWDACRLIRLHWR